MLPAVERVYGLCRSDAGQIAVALIGEYEPIGPKSLDTRSQSGGPTVWGFLPIDVDIAVSKDGATYRTDADGLLFHAHFGNDFGHQLVHNAMGTTGTVVHWCVVHQFRLSVNKVFG